MNQEEILKLEYTELCKDWRMRDKYVLDKLNASYIFFALIGLAIATTSKENYLARLLLALMGFYLALVFTISVFKDIYYRDGTQELIKYLFYCLKIEKKLHIDECDEKFPIHDLKFPRKIEVKLNKTSLKSLKFLKNFKDRDTFKWVLSFYLISSFIFIALTIYTVYDWVQTTAYPSWVHNLFTLIFSIILVVTILVSLFRPLGKLNENEEKKK